MSKFDPQFEKKRKEKKAAEEQAAEQAALKNEAPPAPAADANAADAKTVTPAEGSGKETQPAPDAKATATTEPVTEPPTKDAAAPAKDSVVSADAPATKKDGTVPAAPATAAPGKSPATSPSVKPPTPPTKGWSLTDPARRGERPLRLTQEEEKKKEDERQKLARRNEELELRKAIKNQNYFELSEFSGSKNPEAERKKMIVEMYVLFHERGKSLPGDEKEREIRRIDMAFKRFKGRGAESVDAFFEEMQKEVKAQEEAEAFDVELYTHASRSYVISKFEPERSGEFGWKQFSEAAKKHPSYNPADEGKLFPMWEAIVKDTDRRIAPFAAQAARIWEGIKQDNAASVAASVYREIAPKDRAALMDALGMLARALPKDEQATLLGNLMKQAERDIGTLLGNIASMPASGKDLYGLGDFIEYPGSEKTTGRYLRAEWETKRQELLIARNFQIDIQRIGYEIYDPMKSAFGEGAPGILESAFYSMPGAFASTAVALIPYGVGPTLLYSSMEASSYDSMRRQLIDSGMSDEDATRYAATWAPYVALPQVGLERLQAGAILGKLPFLEKAFTKFGDKIASDVIRGALRTGAGALQETSIEITQDYLPHLLQDTAAALSEDVPDVVWRNGKDGVLDGFWAQSATTFITMLPLAVLGAAGGINADQRVKAFSNASDSTLLALGGSPEAIAALRAAQAQGHASTDAAINHLMSTLNPNSVSARQAVAQLEVEQQEGVQAELSSGEQADAANGDTPSTGDPAAATATPAMEDGMAPAGITAEESSEVTAANSPSIKDITPEQRQDLEQAAFKHISATRIANTDDVRPLIPGYKDADPLTRDAEYHKIASSINHQMIDRLLAQTPNGKRVIILAGGAGSGKTTASGINNGVIPMDFAIDTVMGWKNAIEDLNTRIENSGREATFIYVYTPFEKALPRVIERFLDKSSDPRLVPLSAVIDGHIDAQQNILNASNNFIIQIIDNSGDKGNQRIIDRTQLEKYDYLREQGREEASPGEGSRAHRPNDDRQHQPSSGREGTEGARDRARARLLAEGREILKRYQREGKLTQREVDAFLQEGEFAPKATEK